MCPAVAQLRSVAGVTRVWWRDYAALAGSVLVAYLLLPAAILSLLAAKLKAAKAGSTGWVSATPAAADDGSDDDEDEDGSGRGC